MIELFDVLTYDYDIVENIDITTTDPDWTEVLNLVTPNREAGLYKINFGLQFSLNSTSQSFLYRFSTDGGTNWGPIYSKEVKDRSNIEVIEVEKLQTLASADAFNILVEVTREGSADCEVLEAFISVQRVG